VLSNIGISKITLPYILKRVRDVREDVRKHTFSILAKKVNIKVLTIAQRIQIIENGINDRSDKVQQVCVELICNSWIPNLNNDLVKVLFLFLIFLQI
jgi:hypothetical protein